MSEFPKKVLVARERACAGVRVGVDEDGGGEVVSSLDHSR